MAEQYERDSVMEKTDSMKARYKAQFICQEGTDPCDMAPNNRGSDRARGCNGEGPSMNEPPRSRDHPYGMHYRARRDHSCNLVVLVHSTLRGNFV